MRIIETDVAVIGAGPAGLSAATEAASAGAKVLVIDENSRPGGQLFKQLHKFFGSSAHLAGVRGYEIGRQLLEQVEQSGAKVMLNSLAYGYFPDKGTGLIHENRHYMVKAGKTIFASGAKENYMAFPGSTLPGVMGAGAAQTMININRVLPGKRVVMVGSGNVGLIVSYQLMQAGAEVAALLEGAPKINGYGVHAGKLRRAGIPILTGHSISRILGKECVEGVEITALDELWKPIPGTQQTLQADTVCLAVGLNPMTELLWQAGCRFTYIPALGGHVPLHNTNMETTVPGIYVAGDVTGVEEASSAMEEGRLAGIAAAETLGFLSPQEAARKKEQVYQRLSILRSGYFGTGRRQSKERQLADMDTWRCEKEVNRQ